MMKFRCNFCTTGKTFVAMADNQDEGFRVLAIHINIDHGIDVTPESLEIQDVTLNVKIRSSR